MGVSLFYFFPDWDPPPSPPHMRISMAFLQWFSYPTPTWGWGELQKNGLRHFPKVTEPGPKPAPGSSKALQQPRGPGRWWRTCRCARASALPRGGGQSPASCSRPGSSLGLTPRSRQFCRRRWFPLLFPVFCSSSFLHV